MGLTEGDCGWIWLSEKELLLLLGLNLDGCMNEGVLRTRWVRVKEWERSGVPM